jgi:nitroreductase
MNIAISGFFHTLQACHFSLFSELKSMSDDFTIDLLVFPCQGFKTEETARMLSELPQVSNATPLPSLTPLDESILCRYAGIVQFTPDPFPLPLSRPVLTSLPKSSDTKFVLNLARPHPDFVSAWSLFGRRRSPREFTTVRVSDAIIQAALTAAQRSPSAGNLQAYSIIQITNPDVMARIAAVSLDQQCVARSAGLFVIVMERHISEMKYRERGFLLFSPQDAAIACSHLQLALEAFGVQSRWVGAFDDRLIADIVGLTGSRVVAAVLTFGYGIEDGKATARRRLEEYVTVIR